MAAASIRYKYDRPTRRRSAAPVVYHETSPTMGGKVLICLLCLLTFKKILAKAVNSAVGVIDNVSAESVPRLYSDRSVGVYASANPYAAYSFHVPTFVAPKSNVVPVKEENVVVQNVNGYLKDSYGQRFVQAPQTLAYKSTFPQQYVQLQNLPAHLSQPLVAAAPNLHYTHGTPHFFGQSLTRLPNLQAFSPQPNHILASPQQFIYANNLRNLAPSAVINTQGHPTSLRQATINNNVYANTQSQSEPKLQRIQEEPKVSATNDLRNQQTGQQITQRNNLQLVQATKENLTGKKTVVTLNPNPVVPLLDLTLLEPLRFANPIIPQVQHFLPRINNVKYQKLPELEMVKKHQMEFMVQNTKSYDSDSLKSKPKKESPKKKQKKHPPQSIAKDEEEVHEVPTVTIHDNPHEGPELSYEINSPNYKETITEKKISYNKQTQSEPVHISYDEQNQLKPKHYTYEKRTEMKPINYNFVHNSKQPVQDNQEYHNVPEKAPKQHVQNVQFEEKSQQPQYASLPQNESEDSGESYDANKEQKHNHGHHENHGSTDESPNRDSHDNNYERPHQKVYYHNSESDDTPPTFNLKYPQPSHKGHSRPQNDQRHFQPIVPEYEEDITILPTHKPHASSHADRNHHRQYNENHNRHSTPQNDEEQHNDDRNSYYSSAPIIVGKPKQGKEEEEDHSEELMAEMVLKQRENEQNFDKAYKDAAFGFPAYDKPSFDAEQHIYNPEAYGASRYYKEYDTDKSPLRQYEADGDDFPKFTRSQYKDIRDKTNDEYFDRYVASKPESIVERNNKKEDYYKTFVNQRPKHYFGNEEDDKNQKSKYTAAPSFSYNTKPQRTQTHSKYQAVPHLEEYDYPKQATRDNSPHATQTFQRYKSKTHFVEPQYQYGFEPVSLPHLLDSEMAVMASILSPKKAKPGIKKKEFKDNTSPYTIVKRTVTKGAKAAS